MIGWLQGELADPWQLDKRYGLQLRCHGVGYDVQVSHRQWLQLPVAGSPTALHIHASIREDSSTLYGFSDRHERDLFRELVAVSGVGPQMALGLLGAMAPGELIQAIVHADLRRLTQAPGVGKRTAERLAVELRSRLQKRFLNQLDASFGGEAGEGVDDGDADLAIGLEGASRDEVHLTLGALGYEALEIQRAIRGVAGLGVIEGAGANGRSNDTAEDWIRECLRWLSRDVA
jgi:Holliday junction DNA helicase RuvA